MSRVSTNTVKPQLVLSTITSSSSYQHTLPLQTLQFTQLTTKKSHSPEEAIMIPYATIAQAEMAMGRNLTFLETRWFHYSATMPDYLLYYHSLLGVIVVYTLLPLPVAFLEVRAPAAINKFKLQPKVRLTKATFWECYKAVMRMFVIVVAPVQIISYPTIKMIGIRSGLPLPSLGEIMAQLVVYLLVEDYLTYWFHRLLHGKWIYEKIHYMHHEFTVPLGFAASYTHWAEALIVSTPSFVGPALVPCHMITFWIWLIIRQAEAIETHSGYEFPLSPTKFIPFYGGAEHHDYHHHVGGPSQSNFASVFTYCDYIYGTDKGYRFYKAHQDKLKQAEANNPNGFGKLE